MTSRYSSSSTIKHLKLIIFTYRNICERQFLLKCFLILTFIFCINGSSLPLSTLLTPPSAVVNALPTTAQAILEPINGTQNFRIYGGKKNKEEKHWLDGRGLGMQHVQCARKGNCEKLNFTTCLGATIPYKYTSLDLTISHTQSDVQERLNKYMTLKHMPKCWTVIQVSIVKAIKINIKLLKSYNYSLF